MKFKVDNGPHIKSSDNTSEIMARVFIALAPIICFAIYKNTFWVYFNGAATLIEAMHPIFMVIVAVLTSLISEILFIRFILKKKDIEFKKMICSSYAALPGLFLSLIIPINTPLWLVCVGAFFATVVGKMLFGGFGYNIFNPALTGALFITTVYSGLIASKGGFLNSVEVDTIGSATPLTNLSNLHHVGTYSSVVSRYGDFSNFFFGTIPGTLGETCKFLIILALIYLIFTRVIKWRIPVYYLSTVFIMTFIIGLFNNMGIWFPLFELLSGGLLFGSVFMATDPVTSPITKSGQALYAICLGILTVSIRFLTNYPEGVLTSILTMNMLVFIFDKLGVRISFNLKRIIVPLSVISILLLGITFYISNDIKITNKPDVNVQIINKTTSKGITTYTVNTKGFGIIKASVVMKKGKVTKINIIDANSETHWNEIVNNDYINKLIEQQGNVDTISGSTKTSSGLKNMVIRVIQDYESK